MVVFAQDGKAVAEDGAKPVVEPATKTSQTSPEPTETPVTTYTEEQVKARENKARNDALADLGRVRKAADEALARLDALTKSKKEEDELRKQEELAAVADDPDATARLKERHETVRLRHDIVSRDQELASAKEKLATYEKAAAEQNLTVVIHEVATRLGVDPGRLSKVAALTDGSQKTIEELADALPRITVKNNLKPDSNRSDGGNLSDKAIVDAYIKNPYDITAKRNYYDLRKRRGE